MSRAGWRPALAVNMVSETGDIKNDNALLLQQGNLPSPRDRISKSSSQKSIVMPENL